MLLRRALVLALLPAFVGAQDRTSTDLFTWSGKIAAGGTLGIKHFNGPLDVREGTGDRAEVRAERGNSRSSRGEDITFKVENNSNGVTICSVWRDRNICDNERRGWSGGGDNGPPSTKLIVLLPKGVRLEASTGNGAISVDKASNDIELRTGNGDVRLTMTAGNVDVTSGNGELEIDGATGPVRASTGNGRVYVSTSSGPVNVHTGNGAIDVRMKAITGSGDMSFTTGNGSVTVALPEDFNGEIDANTGHGDFRSDFEIRVLGRLNPRRVRGSIGTGSGRLIRLSTGNGPLELRKS
jgi:DUF4097 and DUF4098 domain-containing protein YvlB